MTFLVIAVFAGFAIYVMTPQERARLTRVALVAFGRAQTAAVQTYTAPDPFVDALRARTPWPVVTPLLVAANVAVFARMLVGDGALGDPATLVAWGGSVGLRTTNGEWWRLVTSMFVHAGPLHLLAAMSGLLAVGLTVERLVGPVAFATVYAAAGVFAGLGSMSASPMDVSAGSSGAVFGVYGLFVAASAWGLFRRSALSLPLGALKRLAPPAAVFLLYSAATGDLIGPVAAHGFVMGLLCGLMVSGGLRERKPPVLRSATAMAAALVIAVGAAVPLRGFIDVRPEIERIFGFEARTASAYDKAVAQFTAGSISAEALADVINRTILPELQTLRTRVGSMDRVPAEHQQVMASAREFLRLRDESWRLRADGLLKHNMLTLRQADRTERASLDVLVGVRPSDP